MQKTLAKRDSRNFTALFNCDLLNTKNVKFMLCIMHNDNDGLLW